METSASLKNKTILIVGATSLVGRQTAIACAQHGGTVIAINRELSKLNDLLEELHGISDSPHVIEKFDIAESDKICALVDHLILAYGPIHCFVHSPGITTPCPFCEVNPQLLERLFRINVISAFEFIRHLAKHPRRPCNAIGVFIAPIAASDSVKGMSAYAACRGAIISSMRVVARELEDGHIHLNYLIPGLLRCEGHFTQSVGQFNPFMEEMSPCKKAETIAANTVALLSGHYDFVNGEIVMFDHNDSIHVMTLKAIPLPDSQYAQMGEMP